MKASRNLVIQVPSLIALHHRRHYNARAKHRPAWKDRFHNATNRRLADGRGVFSAGGRVSLISKVLLAQLGLSVVLAMLFWGIGGGVPAYSALLGGLTCVIPNAFLALRLVAPRRDPGPQGLVRAAYIGELGKLALTVLMFGIVFALVRPIAAWPLFTGFIAAQLMTFAGVLMRDKEVQVEERTKNGD
ncbi:MAG: ATP synthase subunit I [Woeseia sp.]